jgi:hypothetical protein
MAIGRVSNIFDFIGRNFLILNSHSTDWTVDCCQLYTFPCCRRQGPAT